MLKFNLKRGEQEGDSPSVDGTREARPEGESTGRIKRPPEPQRRDQDKN
jgi:hypothetical protein